MFFFDLLVSQSWMSIEETMESPLHKTSRLSRQYEALKKYANRLYHVLNKRFCFTENV